jgi:starch phosphorylase
LYRKGYFRQFLNPEGWQQEQYPETELSQIPVERVRDSAGNEITISVQGPEGTIHAAIWRLRVGRIPLFLLDSNIPENPPGIRDITARLYAGELKIRLAQEILLGIGGMRALAAMGIFPQVCHMNEGHPAFSVLERLVQVMGRYHVDLGTALEIVRRANVFTTHTPVAAGHDVFPTDMVKPYLQPFQEPLGIHENEILSWGQASGSDFAAPFSMSILALRMSQYCNAVSELHGQVARRMWNPIWPQRPENEIPISHVTNGVHISTWISPEIALLFERHLGPDWYMGSRKPENVQRIEDIYEEELWRAHEMSRTRLIRLCRELIVKQYEQRNAPKSVISGVESVLDQDILTIAFARRFATYKRANLIFHDPQRLAAMISSKTHPVQFIFAGKAHPKDDEGKKLIQQLFRLIQDPVLRNRIVFIEDYDMRLARYLVQGADIWLNNPRRPNEACGTSGMKAAVNGVLNVSILDGWWCEGYSKERGWKIAGGEEYADLSYQDAVESHALYNLLENEVIPHFYAQKSGDLPVLWIRMMKESMKMAMKDYCSLRMVGEYENRYYRPIAGRMAQLTAEHAAEARNLKIQRERLCNLWANISLEPPVQQGRSPFRVGVDYDAGVKVFLGQLRPEEVDVEFYYGQMRSAGQLEGIRTESMTVHTDLGNGYYIYFCKVKCDMSGRFGYMARVTPKGDSLVKFTPGFITWS